MRKRSRFIALVLSLALAVGMLAGCSGGGETAASEGTSVQTEAAGGSETAGGSGSTDEVPTLRLASLAGSTSDKIDTSWKNHTLQTTLLFRTLFLADSDLQTVQPDLAESYELSDDGLVYTIKMKDGLKWSDGEDLTAEDVAFSIKANLKASVTNGIYTTAFMYIEGAQEWKDGADDLSGLTVDGNTITITLTTPYATFIPVLAQFDILPEHVLRDVDPLEMHNNEFWSKPVCSGMYMVEEHNAGNYYIMVPNPYYEGEAPKIQRIINYWVTDMVTTAQAGNLDYYTTNNPEEISQFNAMASMEKIPIDILFYRYFICNMSGVDGNENPVMQDVRVREAILHAIDREALAASLFPDLATVVNSGVLNSDPEYNGVTYEYDPELARQLLEEANFDFSKPLRILYYYSDQVSIDFMDAVAYYLNQIGVQTEITQTSTGTVDMFQTRDYDIAYKGLSAFAVNEWYGEYQSTNNNFMNIFGGDTAFDELTNQLNESSDPAVRSETLSELQELEQEMLYKLPLYTIGHVLYINTDHVQIPDGVEFANPWYRSDIDFENWEIVG